jgi:HPt (histidine-containing phosphotransfer) domain-containing protein
VERRFERLSQLVTDNDAQGIEFEAHGLRGMAATIGAEGCMAAFAELEQLGADRRVRGPAVRSALERARVEVDRARQAIEDQEGYKAA